MAGLGGMIDLATFGLVPKDGPKVPKYGKVDTAQEQADAIAGNQRNLPAAEAFAGDVNQFTLDQMQKMLSGVIPGLSDIQSAASGNILSELKGELPKDVQEQVMRSSAFKSLRGGFGGGGMSDALTTRDLGLTSLDLTGRGLDSASKWITSARSSMIPGQFDISSSFLSAKDKIGIDIGENQMSFQRDWLKGQVDAAPGAFEGIIESL